MASRVLLISANRCTTPDPVFPLGLTYLNAALRQRGHETAWVDRLANRDDLAETIKRFRPDYVGISLRNIDDVLIRKREVFFDELIDLCESIRRQTSAPVILGGSGFSIFPKRLLEVSGANFGIAGEGETSLLALIEALNTNRGHAEIPGLVFRRDGEVVVNPAAPEAFSLRLSDTDRPGAIAQHYLGTGGMLNVQTQRGCGCQCCYCTYPLIEGRRHRRRPAELVADEFAQLERQGGRYVFIVDSVFNSSLRHVTEVCEALIRHNVSMAWGCFLRPQGLTDELMDLMARAGLAHIEFGSDSFCDQVLAAYQKGFTFSEILHSSEVARRKKVDYCHFVISGGPGETMSTLQEGYENSMRLNNGYVMAVVGMRIYPGTPLFARAVAEGRFPSDADLLAPAYYLTPELKEEAVFERLQEFARRSPNWIVGDPTPGYTSLIERLRRRGVPGPLWSYFSAVQRAWQPPSPSALAS